MRGEEKAFLVVSFARHAVSDIDELALRDQIDDSRFDILTSGDDVVFLVTRVMRVTCGACCASRVPRLGLSHRGTAARLRSVSPFL